MGIRFHIMPTFSIWFLSEERKPFWKRIRFFRLVQDRPFDGSSDGIHMSMIGD